MNQQHISMDLKDEFQLKKLSLNYKSIKLESKESSSSNKHSYILKLFYNPLVSIHLYLNFSLII